MRTPIVRFPTLHSTPPHPHPPPPPHHPLLVSASAALALARHCAPGSGVMGRGGGLGVVAACVDSDLCLWPLQSPRVVATVSPTTSRPAARHFTSARARMSVVDASLRSHMSDPVPQRSHPPPSPGGALRRAPPLAAPGRPAVAPGPQRRWFWPLCRFPTPRLRLCCPRLACLFAPCYGVDGRGDGLGMSAACP